MGKRQRLWAKKARAKLIEAMGGKCSAIGCEATTELEIDHPNGRDYPLDRLGVDGRILLYRQEFERGEIRLLCSYHNKIFRKRVNQYDLQLENAERENDPF